MFDFFKMHVYLKNKRSETLVAKEMQNKQKKVALKVSNFP